MTTRHSAPLVIVPVTLKEANSYVAQHHRHHRPPQGALFAVAVAPVILDAIGDVAGVAIVGRPVSRMLDDGWTVEVVRVAVDAGLNIPNRCSALYGACWRAARAMGYRKALTYTLASESGHSVKAAGWKCIGAAGGGSWSRSCRPRVDSHPTQMKLRWEVNA